MTVADADPTPPRVTAGEFLRALYGGEPDGWVSLFIRNPEEDTPVEWGDTIDAIRAAARRHVGTGQVWFGVSPRTKPLGHRRGGKVDCTGITALWVDIDIVGPNHASDRLPADLAAAHQLLTDMPLPPSAIVHTGGGIQAWWFLSEALDHDDAETWLTRWGATWATLAERRDVDIDNVFNIDRVMRLPGTYNRKGGGAELVTVTDWHPDRRFGLDDIEQYLLEAPTPPPSPRARTVPYIGPKRPGDEFNERHTGAELLAQAGFTLHSTTRGGDQHWTRPGKPHADGWSATVYAVDGHTTIWTDDKTALPPSVRRHYPYDPFGLYVAWRHGGDFTAARAALAAAGYGENDDAHDILAAVAATAPANAHKTPQDAPTAPPAPIEAIRIPDTLWDARPWLTHIRQAARSRMVAPDAVLGAVLARVAAGTPHTVEIPPIVGSPKGLTFYAGIVGNPETGKSAGAGVASELAILPPNIIQDLPTPSGEGMVEILFDMVDEPDDDGKKRKVKRQVRFAASFHVDEGSVLADLGDRSGATLLPTLRSAWSHETIGNTNASIERRRLLAGHCYVFGITLAIQPGQAGRLLADVDAGTPQRFVWFTAIDPDATTDHVDWPGELDWQPPSHADLEAHAVSRRGWRRHQLTYPPHVIAEVRAHRHAVQTGQLVVDNIDAHSTLARLKVAALIALVERRLDVTGDDWDIAGVIMDTSRAVRDSMRANVAAVEAIKEDAATRRQVARELHTEDAKERRALISAAKSVGNVVHRHAARAEHDGDGCARRCVHAAVASKHRALVSLDDVVEHAVAQEWIAPDGDRWRPGPSRPA